MSQKHCKFIKNDGTTCKQTVFKSPGDDYCIHHSYMNPDNQEDEKQCAAPTRMGGRCAQKAEIGAYCEIHADMYGYSPKEARERRKATEAERKEFEEQEKAKAEKKKKPEKVRDPELLGGNDYQFSGLSPDLYKHFMLFRKTGKEALKDILDEIAMAKAIVSQYRHTVKDLKCKCGGLYKCDSCGSTVVIDNSEKLLDLIDKETKIIERFHKIEDSQKLYIAYISGVLDVYMRQLIPLIQQYVRDENDTTRLATEVTKFSEHFHQYAIQKLCSGSEPNTPTNEQPL